MKNTSEKRQLLKNTLTGCTAFRNTFTTKLLTQNPKGYSNTRHHQIGTGQIHEEYIAGVVHRLVASNDEQNTGVPQTSHHSGHDRYGDVDCRDDEVSMDVL